jgi:hypothetical protein
MDEDGSDEDDSDDDEEEEGDGSERGEGNVEEHPHDGSEDSDGGDSCDKSEARDGGDDGADDDDSSDKSESAHIQGEKEDSGSEDESERCSLAGQLGAREDIEAGGGSDGVGEEYHNGTKRHDFKDRKLDAGDLPPFSSEALVLDKVRRIRQSRSKQHSGGRGGASYSSTMPSACDRSIGLPKLRSHSTTNPPSSGAPTPPSSAMSVAIQIDQRRLSDGLTSELKKEVETAKVAAMKEITEAARMVDEKADRLDRMMMDFETRMAQAYTTTQVADVGRQSPNVTDHVTPSTWSTHRGIREIRYDLPRSDKSAKHSDSHASATASSAQTPSAPKTSPGFSAARKIISYLPGSLSHSKASTGSTPGTSEMGAANRWPSEWPMYWEGGDPTGLGRERKDDGEAGDTGVAEWELQAELSEFIGSRECHASEDSSSVLIGRTQSMTTCCRYARNRNLPRTERKSQPDCPPLTLHHNERYTSCSLACASGATPHPYHRHTSPPARSARAVPSIHSLYAKPPAVEPSSRSMTGHAFIFMRDEGESCVEAGERNVKNVTRSRGMSENRRERSCDQGGIVPIWASEFKG